MRPPMASRRLTAAGALLAGAAWLGAAAPAFAQGGLSDARWQAWIGCWQPADLPSAGGGARALLVCVVPVAGSTAVDIVTVADTLVVAREPVDAAPERRTIARDGCQGWASAEWSGDARRVYLRSAYTCGGGIERRSSGLMAMSPRGEWLDVQAVTSGNRTGVRTVRYKAVEALSTLPSTIAVALAASPPDAGMARTAASAPLSTDDVAEAARRLDAPVVEAWLAERGQGWPGLNARQLTQLAAAGVPGSVTDVMVALSYPRTFAVNAVSRQAEIRPSQDVRGASVTYGYSPYGSSDYYSPYGWDFYGPFGLRNFSPYGYDPYRYGGYGYYGRYGYSSYGYSPYGYNPYGYNPYGYYQGYDGYYYGGGLVVIDVSGSAPPHGRVVRGRGYTQDPNGPGSGSVAVPRQGPEGSRSGGGGAPASGGGATPSSGGSSGPSSGSGSGGARTAHPRPPSD